MILKGSNISISSPPLERDIYKSGTSPSMRQKLDQNQATTSAFGQPTTAELGSKIIHLFSSNNEYGHVSPEKNRDMIVE